MAAMDLLHLSGDYPRDATHAQGSGVGRVSALTRTQDELRQLLSEQVRLMRRSAKYFDEGDESEAKRLATHIRVLVHDTKASHSLLGLLGVKASMRFVDTTLRPDLMSLPPGAIIMHSGIT